VIRLELPRRVGPAATLPSPQRVDPHPGRRARPRRPREPTRPGRPRPGERGAGTHRTGRRPTGSGWWPPPARSVCAGPRDRCAGGAGAVADRWAATAPT